MTALRKTRGEKKQEKRERIRDAAWELFQKRGYDATTTKAVAERAGVASGTLFLYAPDKAELLFLVLHERLSAEVEEGLRTLPRTGSLVDKLVYLFSRFFALYARAPGICQRFVKELPGSTGPNAQRINALTLTLLGQIANLVQEAQRKGELDEDAQPLLVAHIAFALYYAALHTWLSGLASLESAEQLMRASLELALGGSRKRVGTKRE